MVIGYAYTAGFNIKTVSDFVIPGFEAQPPKDIEMDFEVEVTMDKIERLRKILGYKMSKFSCAASVIFEEVAERLTDYNSMLFHSATMEVNGQGIVFSATSGTGKTTHMLNWQKYLGDKLTIVNGDKPIIRFFDNNFKNPIAYDTPWNGKERFGNSGSTILRHICFIERSEDNYVTGISKNDAIDRIMRQTYIPKNPAALTKTLFMVNNLLDNCKLWIIHCNMDISSAEVAYKAIFGK